jgi:hypothetical protein
MQQLPWKVIKATIFTAAQTREIINLAGRVDKDEIPRFVFYKNRKDKRRFDFSQGIKMFCIGC